MGLGCWSYVLDRWTLFKFNTLLFALADTHGEVMGHTTEMLQKPEFAAREKGCNIVSHQAGSRRRLL